MVMDVVVQNPQKSFGYDQFRTMRKNRYVVTPRCATAAAAVVSPVVLRRPTKEDTHRLLHDASQIDYCRYLRSPDTYYVYIRKRIPGRKTCEDPTGEPPHKAGEPPHKRGNAARTK